MSFVIPLHLDMGVFLVKSQAFVIEILEVSNAMQCSKGNLVHAQQHELLDLKCSLLELARFSTIRCKTDKGW